MKRSPEEEGRGSVTNAAGGESTEPRFLVVGRVTRPHGIAGDVRVEVHTEMPERFDWLKTIYLGQESPRAVGVEGVRHHKGVVLLKLAGYDSRNDAETLRGVWLQVPEAEGLPLADGEYYLYQAMGLNVVTDDGRSLGKVREIIETGANNVFVVAGPEGEILLPDTDEVVLSVDLAGGQMVVHLLPGLI